MSTSAAATNSVVVRYTLRPEAMPEHVRLVEAVFEQLRADAVTTVDYEVLRLADGVSFVHVSTTHTDDGSNPLPQLSSFQQFQADLANRVATPPQVSPADVIGTHSAR